MAGLPTELERATKNAEQMAHSLGVRVFLYKNLTDRPILRALLPAMPDEHLELIKTFEPTPREPAFDRTLPDAPTAAG